MAKTSPLDQPVLQGDEKLSIGNIGNMHYFVGAIAEVAINNKVVDTALIKQTWQAIAHTISR